MSVDDSIPQKDTRSSIDYYVDEAGDPVLFSGKGRILVGLEGCSKYFILGKLDVDDPILLSSEMEKLRQGLLADPYFRHVPSMQKKEGKTALAFHAKDDVAEVRREVFALLLKHNVRFYAVVRDKQQVLAYVRQKNESDPPYRYKENELYDSLVSHLFKARLYRAGKLNIYFAERGSRDRTEALQKALEIARVAFERNFGFKSHTQINISWNAPHKNAGLQAVDYFLWALQRFYEKSEERFLELVWPKVGVIHDLDDIGQSNHGEFYWPDKPLNLDVRNKKRRGI